MVCYKYQACGTTRRAAVLSKFYLQNWRWVFSSTLDLNQTTAKETTSSFSPFYHYIYYCIGILKLHSLFIPCHHPPFADSPLLRPVFIFFPTCNVFAKGRLRSESRHEDHHVIRLLWYYVCWNCLSTRKRKKIVGKKPKTTLLFMHFDAIHCSRVFFGCILPNIKLWMKVW